ncbi:MAG: hypothetical protein JWM95_227 [Gemmatimonadetes bacterium]|nr:hypothetical protein [Gemmatimonadota bacterium]
MREQLGEHFASFNWAHVCTLTPKVHDCTPRSLAREFERGFIRRLERSAQRRVCWVRALERSPGGIFHLHALVAGTQCLQEKAIERKWKLGLAHVRRYDRTRGAAWYIVKSYGDERATWESLEVSRHMPPVWFDSRSDQSRAA